MRWGLPCDPSELTHFRKRIGKDGAERILASTIDLHGEKAKEKEVIIDRIVQEPKRSRIKRTSPSLQIQNWRPGL
jgi:hypothetical protein